MSGFMEGTPTVEIQLDKPRTLGFTLGAMRRAKELGVLNHDVESESSFMLVLPEYVWACLDTEGRAELSVEAIGELMNPLNTPAIAERLGELFVSSVPKPDPNVVPAAVTMPTAGKSNSQNSGQLASTI